MTVLERIADGLGVPRTFMRLSGGLDGAYPDKHAVTNSPEEVEEMRRRVLLANAGVAVVGRPVDKLGELLALPDPASVPLPSRQSRQLRLYRPGGAQRRRRAGRAAAGRVRY